MNDVIIKESFKEKDEVTFDLEEGKKGLNTVNVVYQQNHFYFSRQKSGAF